MKPKEFLAYLLVLVAATLVITAGCTRSSSPPNNSQANASPATSAPIRVSGEVDAAEPAIATARASNGSETIYVAWVEHRGQEADVMLRDFNSVGQPLRDAVRVNPNGVNATAWRGDPPTVALAPDGTVYVGWTSRVESDAGPSTDIKLSASHDGGQTFAPPVKVNDDSKLGDHGMHSLAVGPDGRVYVAWLDERNVKQMDEASMPDMPSGHHTEANREVFVSSSSDGGRTFSVNKSVATEVCPCCKTNLAVASDGRVYLSWRQVLPGDFRHIAVAASGDAGATFSKPVVVSDDEWVLKGCPVTGAALLPEAKGKLRVLWYAAGSKGEHGIYWSESQDGGQTFPPRTLVAATGARGTPVLVERSAASADDIWGVWETNDNGRMQITTARVGAKPAVTTSVADKGELPAAASTAEEIFVVYLVREGGKGTIWLAIAGRNRESF
jgi:hypothetical protein